MSSRRSHRFPLKSGWMDVEQVRDDDDDDEDDCVDDKDDVLIMTTDNNDIHAAFRVKGQEVHKHNAGVTARSSVKATGLWTKTRR